MGISPRQTWRNARQRARHVRSSEVHSMSYAAVCKARSLPLPRAGPTLQVACSTMPSYPDDEMTLLKRARVEDFEEAVVTRPLRDGLDRALARELVEKFDLLS